LLKLVRYQDCIDACIQGLELLQREEDILKDELKQSDGQEETRRQIKCKFLARLGTCYCSIGTVKKGLEQYEKAVTLDPGNESLLRDFENLKTISIQAK
jgi:tetratricopeptide (TPR) repeat protein